MWLVHVTARDDEAEARDFSFTQSEAEKSVKEALRWFGLVKRPVVALVKEKDLIQKFHDEDRLQAMVRFDPDQTEIYVYFTEFTEDLRHVAYHEVCHVFLADLKRVTDLLEETLERYADLIAMLALRRRRKGIAR